MSRHPGNWGLTFAARAMQREASRPSCVRVTIMQNLLLSTKFTRSSTFSFSEGSSKFFWVYGSAVLLPVSALLYDIFAVVCEISLVLVD